MFYYAQVDSEYKVIAVTQSDTAITAENYIEITEEQYTSGNLVNEYYNRLTGAFETVFEAMGDTTVVQDGTTQRRLSTRLDNMQVEINGKAEVNHTHEEYAEASHTHNYAATTHGHAQSEIEGLETALGSKANTSHTHAQSDVTGLENALNSKANAAHGHSYNELTDTPTIPSAYTHPETHPATMITGLSNVATSGSYEDLSDKPTIPEAYTHPATHPASMITGLPTALPANGGNADTVDGKHASDFAAATHAHSDYATVEEMEAVETEVSGKANANHTHSQYAETTHTHNYAASSHSHAQSEITGLATALNGKANSSHTHSEYAATGHNHNTAYAGINHNHDTEYANISHGHTAAEITETTDKKVMTAAEREKLSGIATGANNYTHPSSHPASMITGLATVATSGSYNDLSNKPTSMTPSAHTHGQSDITGLEAALNGKAPLNATEVLETGTDLNNYTTAGMYSFSVASAPLNLPTGCTNGWLIVIPWSAGSNTIKQFFLRHGTPNSTDHYTYTRLYTSTGGWSNWSTYYTTSNPPTAAEVGAVSKNLQMTSDTGDVSISWTGKNVVTEFTNLASGMYTVYSPIGNAGNPCATEAFRFMCHKTGSANYGWIMAYGGKGSVYTGYLDNSNWQGWKCIYDANPQPLWTGAQYMNESHTVTPSKSLSECRNGWLLLWSDYDPGEGSNNTDFAATVIPKRAYTGQKWNGGQWYCDVPRYSAGSATDSEGRSIKLLLVHDTKIVGTENNDVAPRNDVVLRAIYEW